MEDESDHDSGMKDGATSYPADAIQCEYVTANWIPLGDWDGNCFGIDLNPGPNGVPGQVINFGRDENDKYVLALSWAHFLEDIVEELEAGHLVPARSATGDVESFGRPGHDDQAMFRFFKEWSAAKLPAAFQQAKPVRKPAANPGEIIRDETARRVSQRVMQFVEAMHTYEMKWLEIRPIHKLGYSLIIESESGYRTQGALIAERYAPLEELEIHKHTKTAIAEKKAILERFSTPRRREMAEGFVQRFPLDYDPQRDQINEVRRIDAEHVIVWMHPVNGRTTRYHLRSDGGD